MVLTCRPLQWKHLKEAFPEHWSGSCRWMALLITKGELCENTGAAENRSSIHFAGSSMGGLYKFEIFSWFQNFVATPYFWGALTRLASTLLLLKFTVISKDSDLFAGFRLNHLGHGTVVVVEGIMQDPEQWLLGPGPFWIQMAVGWCWFWKW